MRNIKKSGPLFLALTLVGAALLAGCGDPPQQQQQMVPEVGVITVMAQRVPMTTELSGRTAAYLESDVRPQVGGIIQKRVFTEGSTVKEGQLLYQIDPAPYQAAYDNAKAVLMKAEANLASARLLAQRYSEVVKINAVSKQQYDDAVAAHGQARADVASAKAALESARINLGYTKVTAAVAGHIGKSSVTPGALVTANQAQALARVQQLDPMYVDVTQSTADILRLKRALADGRLAPNSEGGARVQLVLEDGSDYPLEGKLQFSDVTVDTSTGAVTVRAEFPNPKDLLFPGMFVRARLQESINENGILVPQQAVSRDSQGRPTVLLIKDGLVELRLITVERSINLRTVSPDMTGTAWLVSAGLAEGEQVIIEGVQKVQVGKAAKGHPVTPAGIVKTGGANGTAAATPSR